MTASDACVSVLSVCYHLAMCVGDHLQVVLLDECGYCYSHHVLSCDGVGMNASDVDVGLHANVAGYTKPYSSSQNAFMPTPTCNPSARQVRPPLNPKRHPQGRLRPPPNPPPPEATHAPDPKQTLNPTLRLCSWFCCRCHHKCRPWNCTHD